MDALYANTDLIICRAGALTVAETSTAGIPAIFVPLPTAVDDHQTKMLQFWQKQGQLLYVSSHHLVQILFMIW